MINGTLENISQNRSASKQIQILASKYLLEYSLDNPLQVKSIYNNLAGKYSSISLDLNFILPKCNINSINLPQDNFHS